MKGEFTTASQGHPMRGCDGGYGTIAHAHHRVLKILHCHVEFFVFLLHSHHENHSDIGPHREVGSVVGHHKSLVFLFCQIQSSVETIQHISTDGIHLTSEFHVQNTVPKV